MPRRTLEEKITAAKTKMEQSENELNLLLQEQKEKERAARTNRLCKRAGLLEKMLPDTITLTDELFEQFLKRTTANSFGRDTLNKIITESEKSVTIPQGEMPKRNGETADTQIEITENVGGSTSAANEGDNERQTD